MALPPRTGLDVQQTWSTFKAWMQAIWDHVSILPAAVIARGAWASGQIYAFSEYVVEAGATYVCLVPHTAGAVFATDLAAEKWLLSNGVTAADLAASGGSGLIGFLPAGPGAFLRTAQDKLYETISLLDFVNDAVIPHSDVRDGSNTTDLSAAFQLAVNRIKTLGGGVLDCRNLHVYTTAVIDLLGANNLRVLDDGAVFTTGGGDHYTFQNGTVNFATGLTYYTMTGTYAPGDISIMLNTPADAAHFIVGDYIYMRCSQDVIGMTDQPVAEINKVMVIDAGTGVITFEFPITKDFSAFSAYQYGIAVATSIITTNIAFVGDGSYTNTGRRAFNIVNVVDLSICKKKINGRGGPVTRGRFISVDDNEINLVPNWVAPVWRPYFWAVDTGTSDASFRRNNCRSRGAGFVHVHEGQSNCVVEDNRLMCGIADAGATEGWAVLSILGQSWNTRAHRNTIINSPIGSGIRALGNGVQPGMKHHNLSIGANTVLGQVLSFPAEMTACGIRTDTSCENAVVSANIVRGYTAYSIKVDGTGAVVSGNTVPLGSALIADGNKVSGNVGFCYEEIFLSASDLEPTSGTPPAIATICTNRGVAFPLADANTDTIGGAVRVPLQASKCAFDVYWTNAGAGAGDVRWASVNGSFASGANMDVSDGGAGLTSTAPVINILKVDTVNSSQSVTAGDLLRVRMQRDGTHASDTLTNAVACIGVLLKFT